MDYELVLNPSNTDLFPDQSMISKSPPYIVKSTLTRPATQPSRPRSVIHVPRHHIVHYSLSSSSGLSPTPPNPQRGRNRHHQPSGESCSSRRHMSDWPRSRHSTCSCQQPTRSTWILLLSIQLPSQTGQLPTSSLPSRTEKFQLFMGSTSTTAPTGNSLPSSQPSANHSWHANDTTTQPSTVEQPTFTALNEGHVASPLVPAPFVSDISHLFNFSVIPVFAGYTPNPCTYIPPSFLLPCLKQRLT